MQHLLKVAIFPGIYRCINFHSKLTVGRDEKNDLVLKDPSISGQHVIVEIKEGKACITDNNSSNGTLVNNVIVYKRYLENGDKINIGNVDVLYSQENPCCDSIDLRNQLVPGKLELLPKDDLQFTIFSSSSDIEEICEILGDKIDTYLLEEKAQELKNAVNEAINNANIHGNKKDSQKILICRLTADIRQVSFTVTDSGKGFLYEDIIKNGLQNVDRPSAILNMIHNVDAVEYNTQGNKLTLVKNRQFVTKKLDLKEVNLFEE